MNLITPSFGLIFWQTIIFLLMLFLLTRFAWKPILNFIETREKYIENCLENSKKVRNEMYLLQFFKENWIKESNIQRNILLKEAKTMSNLIRLESLQKDKIYKKKYFLQVKSTIEKEKETVKVYVKNYIAHLVIDATENIMRKNIKNKKEQEYVILNYLNAIDKIRYPDE